MYIFLNSKLNYIILTLLICLLICNNITALDNEENVGTSADTVSRKKINKILLINVDDPKITIKGQLYKYSPNTKSWRKVWMVLKEFALFEMGALEDKYAKKSWPIMGYQIEHYEVMAKSQHLIFSFYKRGLCFMKCCTASKFVIFLEYGG